MLLNLKIDFKIFFLPLIILIFLPSQILSQEKTETKDFLVIVEQSNANKVKLECKEGCAWKKLTYSVSKDSEAQPIDEFGMTDFKNVNLKKDPNLSNFLFTIEKIDNMYKFKGVEGTAWTDLSFTILPKEKQGINKLGMIK